MSLPPQNHGCERRPGYPLQLQSHCQIHSRHATASGEATITPRRKRSKTARFQIHRKTKTYISGYNRRVPKTSTFSHSRFRCPDDGFLSPFRHPFSLLLSQLSRICNPFHSRVPQQPEPELTGSALLPPCALTSTAGRLPKAINPLDLIIRRSLSRIPIPNPRDSASPRIQARPIQVLRSRH